MRALRGLQPVDFSKMKGRRVIPEVQVGVDRSELILDWAVEWQMLFKLFGVTGLQICCYCKPNKYILFRGYSTA